jgi:uncharacterized protein with HEPN domain
MKHNLGNLDRINHIIDAIQKIEIILKNVSMTDFQNNLEKHLSVERLLEIIGEATNHISEEILYDEENSTPWKNIIGMRNFLSHEYFRVDYDVFYNIAVKNIIPLKKEILRIKNKLSKT